MKHQRGSIILYTLILIATMLSIGITLAGLYVAKVRSVLTQPLNSVRAVFIADSAAELCLYEARKQVLPTPLASPFITNGGSFTLASLSASGTLDVTASCVPLGKNGFKFRATGVYNGVGRSLEISQ